MTNFWDRVEKGEPTDCWPWRGATNRDGYGIVRRNRSTVLAHRVAFELSSGRPPTENVLHHCDDPPCCNPAHLYEGTQSDNVRDAITRGRWGNRARRKLDPATEAEIARRYAVGDVSQKSLAREYGVAQPTVGEILRRQGIAPLLSRVERGRRRVEIAGRKV